MTIFIRHLPLLLCVLCVLCGRKSEAADRPNIVFLFTDDQASYTLGCYGNPDAITPNIDALAADGILFENHYDTTAICMASRANVFTGMLEYKTGTNFEHGDMTRAIWDKSYPILLRAAGYRTAFAGKFGILVAGEPGGKGILPETDFDRWGGGPGQTTYDTAKNKSMEAYADNYPHSTLSYGAFGADFIAESAKSGKPFCLSISFKAAHQPDTPDPQFDDIYKDKTFTKPANYGREHGTHFSRQSTTGRQYERFESWGYKDRYDEVMRRYHQQVYGVDVAVGMIREALAQHGVSDNTVVIFTSDNGFLCGSHGYGSKVLPYEEASRVPLIVYDPRHENSGKQIRHEALTGNIDFAPTILELAGLPIPANIDGKSLLPLYDDPGAATHESLPLINVWGPIECQSLAVVTKDFKYVNWFYAGEDFEATEELYHLSKDPLELTNTATNPEYQSQLEQLRATYDNTVTHWKAQAVDYNDYRKYGTLFDRTLDWEKKRPLLEAEKKAKGKADPSRSE